MAVAIMVVSALISLLALLALLLLRGGRLAVKLKRIQSWFSGTRHVASTRGDVRVVLYCCLDGSTESVLLKGERVSVGRSALNDIACHTDPSLSRRHLVFERDGEDWTVRDLGSKNGTFVNDVRVVDRKVIRSGDRIMAGHTLIVYDAPAQASSGDRASPGGAEKQTPREADVPIGVSQER